MPNNNLLLKFIALPISALVGGLWLFIKAGYSAFKDVCDAFRPFTQSEIQQLREKL